MTRPRDATDDVQRAITNLEIAAYELATGHGDRLDASTIVAPILEAPLRGGRALLAILRDTAPHVSSSQRARRQFFHAARALVTLHREHAR